MSPRAWDRMAATMSLLLLVVLAGVTWYLAHVASGGDLGGPSRAAVHEPDYFVERFALTRLNARGEPVYRMSADRMEHFPDDDSSEFVHPHLVSLDPAKPLVTVRAQRGRATSEGIETHLYDDVRLTRAPFDDNPKLTIESDYVLLLSEEDIARTDRPVKITSGASTLTGVGMEFNNGLRRLDVQSQVKGTWVAPTRSSR